MASFRIARAVQRNPVTIFKVSFHTSVTAKLSAVRTWPPHNRSELLVTPVPEDSVPGLRGYQAHTKSTDIHHTQKSTIEKF